MQWEGTNAASFVCKFAKDPSTHKSTYFNDVEAHEIATLYARKFNQHLPDRYPRIEYVSAFVVEFVDKPGRPVAGAEQTLAGAFKKYNNNVGAVCALTADEAAELERTTSLQNWDPQSTAQAFSHFSWEHSQAQVLICDIQGVENRFTDPQIHTMNGKGFGLGNLGQTGIRAFLLRHACTDICRAVGLQQIKPKDLNEKQVQASFGSALQQGKNPHSHAPPGSSQYQQGTSGASQYQQGNSGSAQQYQQQGNNGTNSNNTGGGIKRASHGTAGGHHSSASGGGGSDVLFLGDSAAATPAAASAPQQRGMSSSASTACISHQASQALIGRSNAQQFPPQHSSSSSSFHPRRPCLPVS